MKGNIRNMELTVGAIVEGKVKSITNFGAFVELAPGKDGMVHISKLSEQRVNQVEDVLNIGDKVRFTPTANTDHTAGFPDILAVEVEGTVVQINTKGWGGGYGLFIQIDHGNGLETLYAHCSAVYVEKGQKVSRGQLLGLIGNTGNSFGPHLHFEVRKNGRRVNPLNYVKPSKW